MCFESSRPEEFSGQVEPNETKVFQNELTLLLSSKDDMDLKALGFDIAEGVNDPYLPGDSGIFVTRVDKGSIADGRLRYELSE